MKDITTIRRTVATMANQLHKLGYSLSNAFKTAWRRIKESMTCRVSGVTYQNRQQLLQFICSEGLTYVKLITDVCLEFLQIYPVGICSGEWFIAFLWSCFRFWNIAYNGLFGTGSRNILNNISWLAIEGIYTE